LAKSGKVRVIGYNYKDAPEDARHWLEQFGDPYALIIVDEEGRTALDWGIYGAPETFLVDAHGVIRWKLVGAITDDVIREQIEPELAKLAAAP
jgi:cytochrome c biogenesis protein CcmG/thiol:disulfide interchange protein DsbE